MDKITGRKDRLIRPKAKVKITASNRIVEGQVIDVNRDMFSGDIKVRIDTSDGNVARAPDEVSVIKTREQAKEEDGEDDSDE